jgi:hypothetical protein
MALAAAVALGAAVVSLMPDFLLGADAHYTNVIKRERATAAVPA